MTVVEFWVEQYQAVVAEKKALGDKLRETLDENKKLQARINSLNSSNESLRGINSRIFKSLASSKHQAQELKMQLEAEKEENESLHNVIDSFVDKCKELEDKAEGYKKKLELLNTVVTPDLDAQLKSMTERLDKSIADRKELQADRDIWFRKNGEKQAEIEELKKQLEEIKQEFKQMYADGYSDGNEEGQNELWEMLQMVKDVNLLKEFDPECECLGDVIDMDLEDFKEAYVKWELKQKKAAEEAKKQHVEFMRGYLKRYCVGKLCFGCPLYNASEPVSSCLFSKLTDEEIEERYKKAAESERDKMPRYFTSTIEAVFTAEAKINKDLLEKVCGVKPKEEEHKLEYGDVVRLPCCNYDYMYIAPDEKEETLVRLFDPNIHAIVTTHISNVRYNGGRILVSEEDDIRKIWKYMK